MSCPESALATVTAPRSRPIATLLVALAVGVGACSPSEPDGARSVRRDPLYGQYFVVQVYPSVGGRVVSTDGRINCYPGSSTCTAQFAWSATATLNAVPDSGKMFGTWAGDCTCRGTCVLTAGADKYVVPIFGDPGLASHCNFTLPSRHGPEYLNFLGRQPDSFTCNAAGCHGATLYGAGIAPSCHTCHASAGWTGWQTNCSFCHGATTEAAKAGYPVGSYPERSAPPDAVQQRLSGTAAPDRTGAHQAHLSGVTAGGLNVTGPFSCATCHSVPADLSHVKGASVRAAVALKGTGGLPADLGTYDQASGTCTTYCHGSSSSPAWSKTILDCGSCHGSPPPGHPSMQSTTACAGCHPGTVLADGSIDIAGGKHLNGVVEVSMDASGECGACHGTTPSASPHLSSPATLTDCEKCHGPGGHPPAGTALVSETVCVTCHVDKL